MCFSTSKPKYVSASTKEADEEKKNTRAAKQRLVETEGGDSGQELNSKQGKTVRRVFG